MPRRGWSAVPTPAGWFEVIRGPRPLSVQWPKGKGKGKLDNGANVNLQSGAGSGCPVGRWKRGGVGVPQSSSKVRSLEAALVASAKTEVAAALTRAKEQATTQVRFDPDAKVAAARDRAARLQTAIGALGDIEGAEMDALKAALKRALKDAQEMPLEAQIREREGFIERVRKRIAKFDEERAAELLRLEESERKLEELRALHKKQDVPPPVQFHTDPAGEVARLQQLVSELQRQLHQGLPVPPTVSRRVRKREDDVPATEHEVMEWMSD